MVWSSAQPLEHTECSQAGWVLGTSCQHLWSFSAAFWPKCISEEQKRAWNSITLRGCGSTAMLTGGILTQWSSSLNHLLCDWEGDNTCGCSAESCPCLAAHHQMYGFNAYRQEILPLIQKNNNAQKEFRLEAGQLPDQFLKSQTGEENTTFVFRVFCLDAFSFYLLCRPADVLWLHSFCAAIPPCKHTLTTCRFFVNTSQGKTCQMTMTLQLKPCKSQQVLLAGMCACIAFWVWLTWIKASWATGSDQTSNPTPNLPFFLPSQWHHHKHFSIWK